MNHARQVTNIFQYSAENCGIELVRLELGERSTVEITDECLRGITGQIRCEILATRMQVLGELTPARSELQDFGIRRD